MMDRSSEHNIPMQQPGYAGADISRWFRIVRDRSTRAASLEAGKDVRWRLFAGPVVRRIEFSRPIAEGEGRGTFPLTVPDSARSYFEIETDEGRAILAERRLPLSGAYNFRDLGGIAAQDGRRVKWGRIFRSDDLCGLTGADLEYLAAIPIVTVVDFRADDETEQCPDRLPSSVVQDRHLAISPGNLTKEARKLVTLDASAIDGMMEQIYLRLVSDKEYVKRYREFFALLQSEENTPLVFHCSAGKDRTGIAAALVLTALGVDMRTVMTGYLASNGYLESKYSEYIRQMPNLGALFGVKAGFLDAAFNRIRKDYGSADEFLRGELKVDIPRFRELYLDTPQPFFR